MSIAASILPEFDMEMASTRKTLERVPSDKFDFKPHEKSMTMIGLATHIANMIGWGTITLTQPEFDLQPEGSAPYKEEPAASVEDLLLKFDQGAIAARAALAGISDEAMMAPWSLLSSGQVIFTQPRAGVFRGMILNHLIHHRAQLSVYLRMNDVPVPALYGPSADESI